MFVIHENKGWHSSEFEHVIPLFFFGAKNFRIKIFFTLIFRLIKLKIPIRLFIISKYVPVGEELFLNE